MEKTPVKAVSSAPQNGDIFLEKFWAAMMHSHEKIDRQMEEIDRKIQQEQEEKRRQLEESDKKFLRQMEERNRQLKESGDRYYQRLEEKNRQIRESGNKFQQQLLKTRKYRDELEDIPEDEVSEDGKKGKKQKKGKGLFKKIENLISRKAENAKDLLINIYGSFCDAGFVFDEVANGIKILDGSGNVKASIDIILENIDCIMAVEACAKPKEKDIENHINTLHIFREHRDKYRDRREIYGAIMGKKFSDTEKQIILKAGLLAIEQETSSVKISKPDPIPHSW